jgi:tetratricopeptide (TPR) repeat protein
MIVGLGGAVATVRWLEAWPGPAQVEDEGGYLPPAPLARPLTFGYERLAADLSWLRTVQYFGRHLGADNRFPRLRPLLQFTVGLDPHFVEAYRTGALFLWVAGDIPSALALLEEGYRANPARWELPHDLGRLYFLQVGDHAKALRWWTIAQGLPAAPAYLPRFIARLHGKVGHRETALELWAAILNDPNTDEYFRKIAREEIERLGALRPGGSSPR